MFPLKMVIFNSYVSLPEGTNIIKPLFDIVHWTCYKPCILRGESHGLNHLQANGQRRFDLAI